VLRAKTLGWAAIALAIGLSWYVVIVVSVPEATEQFRQFLISPFGVQAKNYDATHVQSVFYYLPRFPMQTLPGSLVLVWLAWEAWQTRFWSAEPRVRFYAVAFLAQFIGWSLVPGKQIHYLLPCVPLMAVVAGSAVTTRAAGILGRGSEGTGSRPLSSESGQSGFSVSAIAAETPGSTTNLSVPPRPFTTS